MNKRYQVFVSSTYEDLKDERKAVIQALLECDCIPAGMELFPASNEDQWSLIEKVIDECDYYLLVIGGRYGSITDEGISYTQKEYEYAREKGKPIIAFIHKSPDSIPNGKTENTDKGKRALNEFKKEVQEFMVKYWESTNELVSEIVISLHKLMRQFPTEGWVKAGSVIDEVSVREIGRLQEENHKLQETNRKLQEETINLQKRLEEQAMDPPDGVELLAQGDETLQLEYGLMYFSDEEDIFSPKKYMTYTTTWGRIFSAIAPVLVIDQGNVSEIEQELNEFLRGTLPSDERSEARCFISRESLGKILIQLKALKYIKKDKKEGIWLLTPYGDYALTQRVAQKSKLAGVASSLT